MKKVLNTIRILFIMLVISLLTYAVMAVITHFSLNYEIPGYKFSDSIKSIFDFDTDIFKFFAGFLVINISWIIIAVSVFYIKRIFQKKI